MISSPLETLFDHFHPFALIADSVDYQDKFLANGPAIVICYSRTMSFTVSAMCVNSSVASGCVFWTTHWFIVSVLAPTDATAMRRRSSRNARETEPSLDSLVSVLI